MQFTKTLAFTALYLIMQAPMSFAQVSQAGRHIDPQATKPFTLVPMSDVKLALETGCGVPPPNGNPCTASTVLNIDFVVPFGGSCHTYKAIVKHYQDNQSTLIITDTPIDNCTRPEVANFNVKMSKVISKTLNSIHLVNPVSITILPRP